MKKTAAILLMAVMMLTNERQKQEILERNLLMMPWKTFKKKIRSIRMN